MDEFLTITALAKKTRVSSKALRYWETLGLLPKAFRSHSGYRKFPAGAAAYVGFVKRSKDMGLTLQQMKAVLRLARNGRSPCVEVETFIDRRISELDEQIKSLSELRQSLAAIRQCREDTACAVDRSKECCSSLSACRKRGLSTRATSPSTDRPLV
ncbi:MAG: MerR family DNA-binding protein [Xanthomonadaceae bacterium]|nr:MerR family DNA-binding protein [Xanthomonadaceae bacterium]